MGRKKKINAKYSPEFKISVIMDMRKNHLGYMETVRKYWGKEINANNYYHRVQDGSAYIWKKEKQAFT